MGKERRETGREGDSEEGWRWKGKRGNVEVEDALREKGGKREGGRGLKRDRANGMGRGREGGWEKNGVRRGENERENGIGGIGEGVREEWREKNWVLRGEKERENWIGGIGEGGMAGEGRKLVYLAGLCV